MNNFDFVIVGMGVAGLCTAFELARKGHHIVCISKHDTFSREQRVQLDLETIVYLSSLHTLNSRTTSFIQNLKAAKNTVALNDLEQFFYEIMTEHYPDLITFKRGWQIKEVNTNDNTVIIWDKLENDEKLHFRHLIGADGAHHPTANLLSSTKHELRNYHQRVEIYPKAQNNSYQHIAVTFEIESEQFTAIKKKFQQYKQGWRVGAMHDLKRMGWNLSTRIPEGYFFADAAQSSFFFAGEVPNKIVNNTQVHEWVNTAFCSFYNVSPSELKLSIKGEPSFFKMNAIYKNCSSVALNEEGASYFVQVGDALISPNYQIGTGVVDAMNLGRQIAKNVNNELNFDNTKYNEVVNKYSEMVFAQVNNKSYHNLNKLLRLSSISETQSLFYEKIEKCLYIIKDEVKRLKEENLPTDSKEKASRDQKVARLTEAIIAISNSLRQFKKKGGLRNKIAVEKWITESNEWMPKLIKEAQHHRSSNLLIAVSIFLQVVTVLPAVAKGGRAIYDAYKGRMLTFNKTTAQKSVEDIQNVVKKINRDLREATKLPLLSY